MLNTKVDIYNPLVVINNFQAQIVIEKMSELSTFETGVEGEDNANYRHPVDTQGNITGPRREEVEEVEEEEEENSDSEVTSSEETTTAGSNV